LLWYLDRIFKISGSDAGLKVDRSEGVTDVEDARGGNSGSHSQ